MKVVLWRTQDATGERSRLFFFAFAVVGAIAGYRMHPASPFWIPVALAGVALAIWHGAYDGVLAERAFEPRFPHRWRLPFYAIYLLLAAAVLLLWRFLPVAALVSFLLYSAFHFGTEAEHRRTWTALAGAAALGAVPIAAACRWWPRQVTAIFAIMLRSAGMHAAVVEQVGAGLLMPAVVLAAMMACRQRRVCGVRLALIGLELLLFRFCPPVVAFAVFFCLWHTPEHLVETSRGRTNRFSLPLALDNLRRGLGPWLLSLAAMAVALVCGHRVMIAYTGLVFIVLSALTVPHMALSLLLPAMRQMAAGRQNSGFGEVAR